MKRRLFWKILFAFWLTFFAITQGVWLLFEISRGDRPSPEALIASEVAPAVLAGGSEAIAAGGLAGGRTFIDSLPPRQRRRVSITPASVSPAAPRGAGERLLVREGVAPDGTRYRITYRYSGERRRGILRSTPPELLILGLIGGLLFSAALAWYLTEPIARLRRGFDQLARGDLEVRLAPQIGRRRDEVADLGRDFDLMAQRLQRLVAARDRLLHDVSHELRSPLARLQLAIGLARKAPNRTEATLDRIEREALRLETLVGEVLALARAEHGQQDDYFDLAGVVASVADDACFEAEASGVHIRLHNAIPDEDARAPLIGSAELVHRAIDNVIRNALRFSGAGDAVDVDVAYLPATGSYTVEVRDNGPGLPEGEIDAMFEPFVRGGRGSGLGLGLSIASRAVAAHSGEMTARNLAGGGLAVVMTFPASRG
ncbi:ATP-binding protein [Sphingomonas flavalba]|uniref:ATP-binding protein n=1 Tax=Sphingomonas flavalba TaxID=2559804 RepID=UPI0039E03246